MNRQKAIFHHAGCPVCVSAERGRAAVLDPDRYDVEVVHPGQRKERLGQAERVGVKSVPALVVQGRVYHINRGADPSAPAGGPARQAGRRASARR